MLTVLSMFSPCTQWVFGPLSPVSSPLEIFNLGAFLHSLRLNLSNLPRKTRPLLLLVISSRVIDLPLAVVNTGDHVFGERSSVPLVLVGTCPSCPPLFGPTYSRRPYSRLRPWVVTVGTQSIMLGLGKSSPSSSLLHVLRATNRTH